MRHLTAVLAFLLAAVLGMRPAVAQEIGEVISITGCLSQEEDDGHVEYVLADSDLEVEEIVLVPGEGIAMGAHVGHTVQVTGVVVADDEEEHEEGEEEGEHDEDELHVRVAELGHVAASCDGVGR